MKIQNLVFTIFTICLPYNVGRKDICSDPTKIDSQEFLVVLDSNFNFFSVFFKYSRETRKVKNGPASAWTELDFTVVGEILALVKEGELL